MIDSDETGPINLGNPVERTVQELAEMVLNITGSSSTIEFHRRPVDDPTRRRPDINLANTLLGWHPRVSTEEGLQHAVTYFRSRSGEVSAAAAGLTGAQFEGPSPQSEQTAATPA
jgi:dTDP-glucose 4,6-dehydratase